MPAEPSRRRREDVLDFLDSLDLGAENAATPPDASNASATPFAAPTPSTAAPSSHHDTQLEGPSGNSPAAGQKLLATAASSPQATVASPSHSDAQSVLKFIDDLTESTRNSIDHKPPQVPSPGPGSKPTSPIQPEEPLTSGPGASSTTGPAQLSSSAPQPITQQKQQPHGAWSWSGLWNSASEAVKTQAHLVTQHDSVKNTLTTMRGAIDNVRSADSQHPQGHLSPAMLSKHLNKLGTNFKSSVNSVMHTIAPPIPEHDVYTVHHALNLDQVAGMDEVVYRAFDQAMEHYRAGEVLTKPSKAFKLAKEFHVRQGDKLTLPRGHEEAFHRADAIIDLMIKGDCSQALKRQSDQISEPDKRHYHSTHHHHSERALDSVVHNCPLLFALQPCVVSPIMGTELMVVCGVLVDPVHDIRIRNISQSLSVRSWTAHYKEPDTMEYGLLLDSAQLCIREMAHEYLARRNNYHHTN
ncbi:hypothetical protein H4R35_002035 [Dimargaris xerosporica]|nr:hypothetical protein H4R35_002035 [Dimargaris xerosporica]